MGDPAPDLPGLGGVVGWGCSYAPPRLSQESQTNSELFSFCREALLLTRGPSSLSSLSGPLLFFSADPRGAAHFLLGSSLRHHPTLLGGCGFFSPNSFSMWDVSSWLPPFLHPPNKCASIAESSAVNHVG